MLTWLSFPKPTKARAFAKKRFPAASRERCAHQIDQPALHKRRAHPRRCHSRAVGRSAYRRIFPAPAGYAEGRFTEPTAVVYPCWQGLFCCGPPGSILNRSATAILSAVSSAGSNERGCGRSTAPPAAFPFVRIEDTPATRTLRVSPLFVAIRAMALTPVFFPCVRAVPLAQAATATQTSTEIGNVDGAPIDVECGPVPAAAGLSVWPRIGKVVLSWRYIN